MIEASRTNEFNGEFKITTTLIPNSPPTWLKRAQIIAALIYILLQTAYFIFIIVCIVLYPRCESAAETPWWINSVFLRLSSRTMTFNDLNTKFDQYKNDFSMQALWLSPVLPLSNQLNPLVWRDVDNNFGGEQALTDLINKVHENNIKIFVDYPLNHLSVQSTYFTSNNDDSYFVWNEQGNTSNWMTVNNNQQSAWTYNNRINSFYLHQFENNNDSIDINYRNNRVFNEIIDSFTYWQNNFTFDGFNLQGISYTYEDYEYRNQTNNNNISRTRHLGEDYLLLARIRATIEKQKILLLDSIDSFDTTNDELLRRYYSDKNGYLEGVQLASLNNFILINESVTNITILFNIIIIQYFIKNINHFYGHHYH
jgi:hypothetical protein